MNIVAIIPVRSGSKGLKNKNVKKIGNLPLLAHTIMAAKKSKYINEIFVSTDSEKYSRLAKKYGAIIPFLRPKKYSSDRSTTESVLKHFANYLLLNRDFNEKDIIVYLQVTELFRPMNIIDQCISKLIANPKIDTAFAAQVTHKNYWISEGSGFKRLNRLKDKQYLPRQSKKPIFREDTGIACATRLKVLLSGNRIGRNIEIVKYDYLLSSLDIHGLEDFKLAKFVYEYLGDKKKS